MADCLPLEEIPEPITSESIKLNGVSMHLIFWTVLFSRMLFLGWETTFIIILVEYIASIFLRDMAFSRHFETTTRENIREGDVIIVCRGGNAGAAADWAELFMYHVSALLYTWSVYGHVGQVFRDYDGQLKVADVRYNKKHQDHTKHYIDSIPEFIKNYEGTHYVVHRFLNEDESKKLTDAVHRIGDIIGHCRDCFNPLRILKTPSKDATPDEIIEFGKKYGLGCAENIAMIQRVAGISQIDDRYVLPYHFSKDQNVKKLVS
jgi:hypothetical protein